LALGADRCRQVALSTLLSQELRVVQLELALAQGGGGMKRLVLRLWHEEEGQDLTEYGLLLVMIGLAAVTAMGNLASAISLAFTNASTSLS